jgi:hypothetical protein
MSSIRQNLLVGIEERFHVLLSDHGPEGSITAGDDSGGDFWAEFSPAGGRMEFYRRDAPRHPFFQSWMME